MAEFILIDLMRTRSCWLAFLLLDPLSLDHLRLIFSFWHGIAKQLDSRWFHRSQWANAQTSAPFRGLSRVIDCYLLLFHFFPKMVSNILRQMLSRGHQYWSSGSSWLHPSPQLHQRFSRMSAASSFGGWSSSWISSLLDSTQSWAFFADSCNHPLTWNFFRYSGCCFSSTTRQWVYQNSFWQSSLSFRRKRMSWS